MMSHGIVDNFLNSFNTPDSLEERKKWQRFECCGSSRSLYCCECYKLLIPSTTEFPANFRPLPFHLHIILHDRRNVATGVHAKVLSQGLHASQTTNSNSESKVVEIFDIERLDPLPKSYPENSYVLFPSDDSIPLESVRDNVNTLVLLDCKWTKSSSRQHPRLAALPRVHLTNPALTSYYWRWHSAGKGCLSTIEAIYEAAKEVEPQSDWTPWLWLFAIQRAAAGGVSENEKRIHRERRRTRGTAKHLLDKEKGKALSDQHKRAFEKTRRRARMPQWEVHLSKEADISVSPNNSYFVTDT